MNMEPASAAQKSIWAIIGDVFFSPTKAFEAFKKKPTIWIPLILTIVMAGTAGFLTVEQAAMDQYDMMKTSTTLPPQYLEQMRQDAQDPSPVEATIGPAVIVPLMGLIGALLAWLIGGFILGGKAKYAHVWGVELLSGLIPMVGGLIRVPMVIAKGTAQVSIGPAALMANQDYVSVMQVFLYFADVFAIWSVIVASFGYSIIFGISRGKGAAVAVITWLTMIVLALTAMLGGLTLAGVDVRFL